MHSNCLLSASWFSWDLNTTSSTSLSQFPLIQIPSMFSQFEYCVYNFSDRCVYSLRHIDLLSLQHYFFLPSVFARIHSFSDYPVRIQTTPWTLTHIVVSISHWYFYLHQISTPLQSVSLTHSESKPPNYLVVIMRTDFHYIACSIPESRHRHHILATWSFLQVLRCSATTLDYSQKNLFENGLPSPSANNPLSSSSLRRLQLLAKAIRFLKPQGRLFHPTIVRHFHLLVKKLGSKSLYADYSPKICSTFRINKARVIA